MPDIVLARIARGVCGCWGGSTLRGHAPAKESDRHTPAKESDEHALAKASDVEATTSAGVQTAVSSTAAAKESDGHTLAKASDVERGMKATTSTGVQTDMSSTVAAKESDGHALAKESDVERGMKEARSTGVQTAMSSTGADLTVVPAWPLRPDESARLQRLCELQALGLESSRLLDEVTAVLGWVCDMPIVLVSLVCARKICFQSRFGFAGRQIPRVENALCAWCINPEIPEVLIVEDANQDGRVCCALTVTGPPHIRFYAGCPLQTSDGFPLGTLCLVDQKPRSIGASVARLLANFAEIVTRNIERIDIESCELPSQRVPASDDGETVQEPPAREQFVRGPLRLERIRESFGDAHLLVLASASSTRWPIVWTDTKWQKLTNTSVIPPSRPEENDRDSGDFGMEILMKDRLQFWDIATWLDDEGLDAQRGGVKRPDVTFAEHIQDSAVFRLPVLLKSMSHTGGFEAVVRCTPAELPLDVNAAVIDLPERDRLAAPGREFFKIDGDYRLYFFVLRPCEDRRTSKLHAMSELSVREASTSLFKDVELKQLVGAGSFGKVYIGDWIGSQVAVKVLQRAPRLDQPGSAFEAPLSSSLWHPNIVQTFEHATREIYAVPDPAIAKLMKCAAFQAKEPMRMYETIIVQEWCDNGSLAKLIEEAYPLGPRGGGLTELVAVVSDVASALAYMHDRGVVHGDLSSNNVLCASRPTSRGYTCKVCDFGLARAVGHEALALATHAASWTPQLVKGCGTDGEHEATDPKRGLLGGGVGGHQEMNRAADLAKAEHASNNSTISLVSGVSCLSGVSEPEAEPSTLVEIMRAATISTQTTGTVQYMPPEMLSMAPLPMLSAKTDIYSLGVIVWQLSTGKIPWQGLSAPQVVVRILRGKKLSMEDPNTPLSVAHLFASCTDRVADERPEARQVLRTLADLRVVI